MWVNITIYYIFFQQMEIRLSLLLHIKNETTFSGSKWRLFYLLY